MKRKKATKSLSVNEFVVFLQQKPFKNLKNIIKMTNIEIIKETSRVLLENNAWESIYDRYAKEIIRNKKKYGSNSRLFQVNSPLLVYSSIGKVKSSANTTAYDLRFAGQSVGIIEVNKEKEVKLTVSAGQAKYAKEKFGFAESKELKRVCWKCDKGAISFRKFYLNNESTNRVAIKSPEHRIESELLKEFSKETRKEDKHLCNIQPVRLGGKFFQLTTPLKGSTHVPTLSLTEKENGATGGGIDILARIKHSAFRSRYAIIELKDENKDNESQEETMFQALIYATFMAHLFRSKSGKYWWYLMKNNPSKDDMLKDINVPDHIDLDVITLMPEGSSGEGDLSNLELEDLNVTLHLYTLYYKTDKKGNPCGFVGTLVNELNKK